MLTQKEVIELSAKNQKKWVLVTGGSRRIGAEIITQFHQSDFNVIIHYNSSAQEANRLCETLNSERKNSAFAFQANLNSLDEINLLCAKVLSVTGSLSLLVNNASTFYPTPIDEFTEDDWDRLVNPNFRAPLFLSQKLVPLLNTATSSIINIIDIHSQRPLKDHLIYGPSKAALAMLTRSLAKDLAPHIRVNGVSPGAILWPEDVNEKTKASILKQIPLNRCGYASDIEEAVYFQHHAQYITGQIITVFGGRSIGW